MAKEIEKLYNRTGIVKVATGSGLKSANVDFEIKINLDFNTKTYELVHKMIPRKDNVVDIYGSEEVISLINVKEIKTSKHNISFKYNPKGSSQITTYGNKPPTEFEVKLLQLVKYIETILPN